MHEVWKPVTSDPAYEVSNTGRVKCMLRKKHARPIREPGWLVSQVLTENGYKRVAFRDSDNGQYLRSVHRLVALEFIPNYGNHPQVNHKDGNKTNNHVSNLEWVTAKQNMKHAVDNNLLTFKSGEKSRNVTYTEECILRVLDCYFHKLMTCNEISDIEGINKNYISLIVRGKRWCEVFKLFTSSDTKYYSDVGKILSKRRVNNRAKVEGMIVETSRMA